MARTELTKQQVKLLLPLTRNICAMHNVGPSCNEYQLVRGDTFYGEFAHICAAEEGGERWVESMSDDNSDGEENNRNGIQNIIVLCPNHHTIIDKKNNGYTIERLKEIKAQHEGQESPPTRRISENAVDNALVVANTGIINYNINSGRGVQQNSAIANSTSPTNFTAARDVIQIINQVPLANALPNQITAGFYVPERTLTLIAELKTLGMGNSPVAQGISPDAIHLDLSIDGKRFVVQHQQLVHQTTGIGTDGTSKYRMSAESVVFILESAQLYSTEGLQKHTLLAELRALTRDQSLNIIVETTDMNIRRIPFGKVDESSAQCSKPLKFIYGGEQ